MTSQKIANIIPLTSPDCKNLHKITNNAKIPQYCQNSRKFLKLSKLTNCKIAELAKIVTIAEIAKLCSHYLMSEHV